jgi:hypothetical protein
MTSWTDTRRQAELAYDNKEWDRAAQLWRAVAADMVVGADVNEEARLDPLYNAACCYSLAGRQDDAFKALEEAACRGFHFVARLETDADLNALHGDARWGELVHAVEANLARWEETLESPELRRELLAMVKDDQDARNAEINAGLEDAAAAARTEAIDRKNTERMKAIVRERGWPGKSAVGADGATAAWLLVQHADAAPAFQEECLARMEKMVGAGEVEAADCAYLADRVAVNRGRKQLYGTQFDNDRNPRPIEDEAHVDERRRAKGLPSMSEYKQRILKRYRHRS